MHSTTQAKILVLVFVISLLMTEISIEIQNQQLECMSFI